MTFIKEQTGRLLAVSLAIFLVSCGPAEQPVPASSVVSEQSEEQPEEVAATEESTPEPDRFANMFISEVTHDFNPGLPIGAQFPAIRALFEGEEILTIDRFIRDRGAIFIAARSTDW
jgi:hypothetical protein